MAALLSKLPITVPVTGGAGPIVPVYNFLGIPPRIVLFANFVWGSGGTSFDVYVQTSFDNFASWIDIANFHFTTASLKQYYNVVPAATLTPVTISDAGLTANTAVPVIGPQLRAKYTGVGTYAGNTSIDLQAFWG